eukprot:TRINITY_DN5230_c0_g1_i1.p1 TRINITY_DN5230_c0_g1~~TRINITY_DN5230_c0_g1_i1.p1  ORF type:complete len:225 (-),score=58.65 TRINITY_DN5230_c0_g1_i1:3-677(-)
MCIRDSIHAVRVCGKDSSGCAIVQVDGRKLQQAAALGDIEAVFMHFAVTLDTVVDHRYTMVLFNDRSVDGQPADYTAMYTALDLYEKKLDKKFEINLSSLVVVHPSYSFKIALKFFSPFVSETLSSKVVFASTLAELESCVEFELLRIPAFSLELEEDTLNQFSDSQVGFSGVPKIGRIVQSGMDTEFEDYVRAASSVIQENWRDHTRGRVDLEAEEEIRAART